MKECLVRASTLSAAYHKALEDLYVYGEQSPCPDYNTSQIEVSMTMEVNNPLYEPMISKFFVGGPADLEQYIKEILDGILDFEIDKGNWKYTYHDRMVRYPIDNWVRFPNEPYKDQIQFAIDELRRNPDSRRAVIDIRDNSDDMYSNDPACLQHIQYFIRDGKLHCKVLFRSNDACKATFMNAFALIMLQKRIADTLGVKMGTYTHRANSFHCYEKDIPTLKSYVDKINKFNLEDLTYHYEEDWKWQMEEELPKIMEKVQKLKGGEK